MKSDIQDPEPLTSFLMGFSTRGRTMLLPALHRAQGIYGWVPPEAQQAISKALKVPLADVHGVIEFYSMFYNQPTPHRVVRVCEDLACSLAGAGAILDSLTTSNAEDGAAMGAVKIERVPCLGMCEHAPVALDGVQSIARLKPEPLDTIVSTASSDHRAIVYGEPRFITGRIGIVDPTSLEDYRNHQGYLGLERALAMAPEELIDLFAQSSILGRGGAMFPFGQKLRFTRLAAGTPSEKHIVVNADESEPGTFKDRCLLEEDPFSVVEAATIAAYAAGAENGWIFVRGEFPQAFHRLKVVVERARETGYLGRNIAGKPGFHFDIEIRLGAGAYICGEETALFEAIEGKRGFPRIKPPFPTSHGLFQQPTAINNVETLVAGLAVLTHGLETWRSHGEGDSRGTKLFCVSGNVWKPGLYEIPFGSTVQDLISLAGGVAGGNQIQAVLMGGAAGAFLGPERLNMPLTYEASREEKIPLGSGVVMVFNEEADLGKALFEIARFFAHESCGKCFPCQLGTERQMEILKSVHDRDNGFLDPRENLMNIGKTMT